MNMFLSRALFKKFRRSFGILIVCVAGCAGLIFSAPAHADVAPCSISSAVISFGSVAVPRNAAVGTPIGSPVTSSGTWSCLPNPITGPTSNTGGFNLGITATLTESPVAGVWNTGTPGIGIKVNDVTYTSGSYGGVLSQLSPVGYWIYFVDPDTTTFWGPSNTGQASSGSFTFTYQLVTTAASVTTGPLTSTVVGYLGSSNPVSGSTMTKTASITMNNTTIVATTCTVTTPSISVTLPTVTANLLSPVGTTAGNTNFSIGLSCQAGANVYVTLTDMTNTGNTTSNLTLASGSTATGVQLRLLKSGGSPVSYGPDSTVAGNTNQWLVGASASTTNIPLTAQYISTGTVGPGVVKGKATFTMSYQ
jgi:type 1 fimbria pilin